MQDDSNGDAQQVTFARMNNDTQIRVFVHRGRISPEKLPEKLKKVSSIPILRPPPSNSLRWVQNRRRRLIPQTLAV